jgi:hypothetical protein
MRPLTLAVAVAGLALSPRTARAEPCAALMSEFEAYLQGAWIPATYGFYRPVVRFTLMGNRRAQDWVEYTTGQLTYVHGSSPVTRFEDYAAITGRGQQLFSDRPYFADPWSTCWGCGFSPDAPDSLGVRFAADPRAGEQDGDVRLTWESWGSPSTVLETECRGEYLYAFYGDDEMYVFAFELGHQWCPNPWNC